jgi:hypothetical protein
MQPQISTAQSGTRRPNLTGQQFGQWQIIEWTPEKSKWLCLCSCGNRRYIASTTITHGCTRKCSDCLRLNLIGRRFGRLLVVDRARRPTGTKSTKAYWKCVCDCGKEHITRTDYLRTNRSTSCGCWQNSYRLAAKHDALWNQLFTHHRWQAKHRRIPASLTVAQFKELSSSNCHYCGGPPQQRRVWRGKPSDRNMLNFNGIDRIDSTLGYSIDNVVTACKFCNVAKHEQSYQEFKAWVSRVYSHMFKADRKTKASGSQLTLTS